MVSETLWVGVLACLLLGMSACAGGTSSSSSSRGFNNDMDCKGSRICVDGDCVAPAATRVRSAPVAEAPRRAARTSARSGSYSQGVKCENPCLFLMDHSYAKVQSNLCSWCPRSSGEWCTFDWPSSDVPDCGTFDHLRNCIYAGHGYSFSKKKWQQTFGRTSWYQQDPNYDSDRLSTVAQRNVRELKRMRKQQDGCIWYDR